jgi:hypothetical protein
MRTVASALLGYTLAFVLMGTSPVGAGRGVHENQLLDALLPHVHLVNGQVVRTAADLPAVGVSDRGPSIGAGAGAAPSAAGLALTPPLPSEGAGLPSDSERWHVTIADDGLPPAWSEAPPDPPPPFAS